MQGRHRKLLRLLAGILLLSLCSSLSGCWDRHELQERNYVLALGIDTADEGIKPNQSANTARVETFVQPHGDKRYRLSLQILKIGTSKGGGKTDKSRTFVISNTGESMFEMTRDMLGQSSKSLWFEHIQTIIISEALVKRDSLDTILDWFLRDAEMRSRIKVYITPNSARSVLEYQPPTNEPGGIYLGEISFNNALNNHILRNADLGFIEQTIQNKADAIIPRLELNDKVLKIGGAAVFKRDRFAGYLDEYALMGVKFIRATEKSAVITANCPEHPENILVFEASRQNTKLIPHVDGNNIYFTLDIAMTGNINEVQGCTDTFDMTKPEDIRKLEVLFAEQVKQAVEYACQTEQRLNVDNLHFDVKLKTQQPQTWSKVKDHWHEIFPTIPIDISVNVAIIGVGKHK